jgi:hypothetical protein
MMGRNGKQSQSGKRISPTTSGNIKSKLALPMSYEEAVSAFLKVKPELKKAPAKRKAG